MICKICYTECNTVQKFNSHIKIHNLSSKEYYDLYLKQENSDICKICGNKTNWINFTKGYREYCSKKCASIGSQKIKEQNNLEKYGVKNVFQLKTVKDKIETTKLSRYNDKHYTNIDKANQTILDKYGVDNFGNIPDAIEKRMKTNFQKYGVENPMQSEIIKNKRIENNIQKYGVESTNCLETTKLKYKQTCLAKYGTEYAGQALIYKERKNKNTIKLYNIMLQNEGYNGEVINYKNNIIQYKCNDCNNISELILQTFSGRLYEKHVNPCLNCNPLNKPYSAEEKNLLNYIKSIYNGIIIENDRTILNGKEIDIYLPEKKLAFEFDGTYWHADPRFYESLDVINNEYASKIWEKDYLKDKLCLNNNIKLIRIKEYDWLTDPNIKNSIKNIINNVL